MLWRQFSPSPTVDYSSPVSNWVRPAWLVKKFARRRTFAFDTAPITAHGRKEDRAPQEPAQKMNVTFVAGTKTREPRV